MAAYWAFLATWAGYCGQPALDAGGQLAAALADPAGLWTEEDLETNRSVAAGRRYLSATPSLTDGCSTEGEGASHSVQSDTERERERERESYT